MTPTGKVDRRALPEPGRSRPELDTPYARPATPPRRRWRGSGGSCWGSSGWASHDSFFELGGHSLLAAQRDPRVRDGLGVELPLLDVFEHPTVAALAGRIESAAGGAARRAAAPPRGRRGTGRPPALVRPGAALVPRPARRRATAAYNFQLPCASAGRWTPGGPGSGARRGGPPPRGPAHRSRPWRGPVQVIHPAWRAACRWWTSAGCRAAARGAAARPAGRAGTAVRPGAAAAAARLLLRLADEDHVLLQPSTTSSTTAGRSAVFLRELTALYAAFSRAALAAAGAAGPVRGLRGLAAQWLHGEALAAQIAWWRRQLAGLPPVLELPTDRPRPAVQSFRGAAAAVRPARRAARPARSSAGARARPSSWCCWPPSRPCCRATPARTTSPWARPSPAAPARETEGLIGIFVNTLVLRGRRWRASPTFRELLGRVRETALEAHAHQDVPFEQLVEELPPERDLARNAAVPGDASASERAVPRAGLPRAPAAPLVRPQRLGQVRPHVIAPREQRAPRRIDGTCSGSTARDLFDAATVDRLIGHFERLLAGAAAEPERAGSRSCRCSPRPSARQCSPSGAARQAGELASGRVHAAVRGAGGRTPEARGRGRRGRQLTYGELDARAGPARPAPAAPGRGAGALVAVCLERSPELVVALLGILKAGGAYLPLDPRYPPSAWPTCSRTRRAGGADARAAERLPVPPAHGPASSRRSALARAGDAAAAAFRVCRRTSPTSSTPPARPGGPRGCEIPHRGLLNLVAWHLRALRPGPGRPPHPGGEPGFDASVWEIWPCLAAGASLHVPRGEARWPAAAGSPGWRASGSPSPSCPRPSPRRSSPAGVPPGPALRVLLTGGDRLRRRPCAGACRLRAHQPLRSDGGDGGDHAPATVPAAARAPPIGRPIDGLRVYLLDRPLQPVPAGVPESSCVGGDGLARGYLGRPGPDGGDGSCPIRSGSRGAPLPHGRPRPLPPRRASSSSSGGSTTRSRSAASASSWARSRRRSPSTPGSARRSWSCASGRPESGRAGRPTWWRRGHSATPGCGLPRGEPARPTWSRPPSSSSEPCRSPPTARWTARPCRRPERRSAPETREPAPRTPVEEMLAGIWSPSSSALERVGIRRRLLRAGRPLAAAAQVRLARARRGFGVELPLRRALRGARPWRACARLSVEAAARLRGADRSASRRRAAAGGPAPLLRPGAALVPRPARARAARLQHAGAPSRCAAPLDLAALQRVPAARSSAATRPCAPTFAAVDGRPVQVIAPAARLPLPLVDLSGLPSRRARPRSAGRGRGAAGRSTSQRGPLLRARLLAARSGRSTLLLLTLHHIVSDGWSMGVLRPRAGGALRAFAAGGPRLCRSCRSSTPTTRSGSASWLQRRGRWTRSSPTGGGSSPALPPLLELPTDRPRPAVQTCRGGRSAIALPPALAAGLRGLARRRAPPCSWPCWPAFQRSAPATPARTTWSSARPSPAATAARSRG